jgi:hypothetical protein
MSLTGELRRQVKAYRDSGNSSVADLNLTTTTVSESHCRDPSCESPFARNFNFSLYHTLEFPRNDDNVYSVTDLLRLTTQSAGESNCGHDPDHGHKQPSITKFVGTTELKTLYKLTSVVKFQSNHYITFAFAPDDAGNMHWARFDDTKPRVEWASPFTRSGVSSTEPVEVLLFYTQLTVEEAAEHAAKAADAARAARIARAVQDESESESESEEDDDDDDEFEEANLIDDTESITSSSLGSSENGGETFGDSEDLDPMQQARLTANVFLAIAEQFSRVGQTDQSERLRAAARQMDSVASGLVRALQRRDRDVDSDYQSDESADKSEGDVEMADVATGDVAAFDKLSALDKGSYIS